MTDTIPQDIPEEIIRRAMGIQEEVWAAEARKEPSWQPIAQALLAERKAQREKDAGIAESFRPKVNEGSQTIGEISQGNAVTRIAAAIRNQP